MSVLVSWLPQRAKRIKKTLFAMVELVEKAVGKETRDAGRGALMHDAWRKVDVHYIGMFACYMRDIKMTHDYGPPMASKSYDGTTGEDDSGLEKSPPVIAHG